MDNADKLIKKIRTRVKLFSSPSCGHCVAIEKYLIDNYIKYDRADVSEDSEARDELLEKGFYHVPVIKVDDKYYINLEEAKKVI